MAFYADSDTFAHKDAFTDPLTYTDPHPNPHAGTVTDPHTRPDGHAIPGSDCYPIAGPDGISDIDPDP